MLRLKLARVAHNVLAVGATAVLVNCCVVKSIVSRWDRDGSERERQMKRRLTGSAGCELVRPTHICWPIAAPWPNASASAAATLS